MITVDSILAATDLTEAGARSIRAAMRLARAFNAELHIIHVGSISDRHSAPHLQATLAEHVHHCADAVSYDAPIDTELVYDRPYHGILVQAAAVGADLIVLGASRHGVLRARWRMTTAERVLRSVEVPCLVVGTDDVSLPIRHAGVAVDLTASSRAGAQLIADWWPEIGSTDAPGTLSLVHVASSTDAEAELTAECNRIAVSNGMHIEPVGRTGRTVADELVRWTTETDVDLLVASSSGQRGMPRMWKGSTAARLTMKAACPVLLVPPAFWRRTPLPLSRVGGVVADTAADEPARAWAEQWSTASGAAFQRIDPGSGTDLLRQAREAAVDLIVVREPRTDPYTPMPPFLGNLLEHTPLPVLVLRDLPEQPIRHILVAVDTGDIWYEKLGWAKRLAASSDARITIYHAVNLSMASRVRREPGGELVSGSALWLHDGVERKALPAMRSWLWERARFAGLPMDRVEVEVGLQDPWFAIPAVAKRKDADLVIVAAHAEDRPGRTPLSRVAQAVLERGTYSALVVVDRAKREATWGLPDVRVSQSDLVAS